MNLKLRAPTSEDCYNVTQWRNEDSVRAGLRTPFLLTEEMQDDFYRNVVCDRRSQHRYWSFVLPENAFHSEGFVAFGGLTDISWENGHAEISLIVSPDHAGQGVGSEAVKLILREAFERMRLLTVFGEVYHCNRAALAFWDRLIGESGNHVRVPRRKFWDGELHDATLFWFAR